MSIPRKKRTPEEQAQLAAAQAKRQEDLEFEQISRDADEYCSLVCDAINSKMPAERARLTAGLKKLFLSNPQDTYWARGLRNFANFIKRTADEKAHLTHQVDDERRQAQEARNRADETRRVYEAYRSGVRDGKGELASCDMDPRDSRIPRRGPWFPWY